MVAVDAGAVVAPSSVLVLDDESLLDGLAGLRWRLRELLPPGATELVVDVSRLERFSSATVAALLWAHRSCRARGGRVVVRDPNKRSLELLVRTGLSDVLEVEVGPSTPRAEPLPGRAR